MDINYPLENRTETDQTISKSNVSHVFCGHFHTEHESHLDYSLYVTPSPAFEVDLQSKELVVRPARIPLRVINIDQQRLKTEVLYLDETGS